MPYCLKAAPSYSRRSVVDRTRDLTVEMSAFDAGAVRKHGRAKNGEPAPLSLRDFFSQGQISGDAVLCWPSLASIARFRSGQRLRNSLPARHPLWTRAMRLPL
jgi:hypothetical protein